MMILLYRYTDTPVKMQTLLQSTKEFFSRKKLLKMIKLKESLIFTSFGFTLAIIAFITLNSQLTKTKYLEKVQKTSVNFDEISHWANNIPALKSQDENRSSILSTFMEKFYKIDKPSEEEIREIFYQVLSQPLQTVCNFPKKIGGKNADA